MKAEVRVSKFDRLHKQQQGLDGHVYVLPNGRTVCEIQDLIPSLLLREKRLGREAVVSA